MKLSEIMLLVGGSALMFAGIKDFDILGFLKAVATTSSVSELFSNLDVFYNSETKIHPVQGSLNGSGSSSVSVPPVGNSLGGSVNTSTLGGVVI